MRSSIRNAGIFLSMLGAAVVGLGCGSASNNDQGVSFNSLGFFTALGTSPQCATLPPFLTNMSLPIGSIDSEPFPSTVTPSTPTGIASDGSLIAVAGYQNHLEGQTIQVRRVLLSYFIAGAEEQPPSTTVPTSMFLAPGDAGLGGDGGFDSSLPPNYSGNTTKCGFSQVVIVPPAVTRWIAFNQDKLPQRPFQMEVTAVGVGTTSSGDTIESNDSAIYVSVTDETLVSPGDGDTDTGTVTEGESTLPEGSDGSDTPDSIDGSDTPDSDDLDSLGEVIPTPSSDGSL